MQYPATVEETVNPVGSECQVPWEFPLEIPQQWGCPMAGPESAAAKPRECNANGDGAACKWQHTDAPVMIT